MQEGDDADLEGRDLPDESEDSEPVQEGGFRAVQREIAMNAKGTSRDTQEVQRLLEEYNKLNYEDIVAGMPTRFRYKQASTQHLLVCILFPDDTCN